MSHSHTEHPACRPIFLGGYFKSGTTLLRAMLGQHSTIFSGLETYWFDLNWENKRGIISKARGYELSPLEEQLEKLRQYFSLEPEELAAIQSQSDSPESFLDALMARQIRHAGKTRWLEKTPGNILHLARIYKHWPGAQCIQITRSPLDVFASCKEGTTPRKNPKVFLEFWMRYMAAVEKSKKDETITPENFLAVEYEELVTDPGTAIKHVLAFLGEPYESDVACFSGREDDFNKVLAVTGQKNTTLDRLRQPLTTSRIGIWKNVLSKDELEFFAHELAGTALETVWKRHQRSV